MAARLGGDRRAGDVRPATSRFCHRDGYHEILQVRVAATYTATQARARVASTGTVGPWHEQADLGVRLVEEWVARQRQRVPELASWVEAMHAADSSFAAGWAGLVEANPYGFSIMQVLDHLEQHPGMWRDHDAGAPLPYTLRRLWRA